MRDMPDAYTLAQTETAMTRHIEGLEIDAFSQERINATLKELQEEQDGVKHLL